jgi:riboflavin synthase
MFTGLVQGVGRVRAIVPTAQQKRLVIEAALDERARELGASVSVSGVCLTVTAASPEHFEVEAAFETLSRTTIGDLREGSRVNLEPALRVGDPLGGHLVSGHVDGVGALDSSRGRGDARELWFRVPGELSRFIAEKGSICIDGVSLTVNAVDGDRFSVGLIPHTLSVTTLGELEPGAPVNLEVDLLARYVARLLEAGTSPAGGGLSIDALRAAGFPDASEAGETGT